ncbi:hypothetical protein TELCIR_23653 [Teladorsagia circumcincta]|uniref:Uncharacterized protein n=1 Tax=Teladorsagia circumcincta TaxID=45464 RepID=A0A2G9TC58_TELCI|nr:hypothetical protein TELCIR_23653 [Teladorsagia circumcincta]
MAQRNTGFFKLRGVDGPPISFNFKDENDLFESLSKKIGEVNNQIRSVHAADRDHGPLQLIAISDETRIHRTRQCSHRRHSTSSESSESRECSPGHYPHRHHQSKHHSHRRCSHRRRSTSSESFGSRECSPGHHPHRHHHSKHHSHRRCSHRRRSTSSESSESRGRSPTDLPLLVLDTLIRAFDHLFTLE